VVECITRSMPRSSGRCRKGVAQVLSQAVRAPADRAISATARRSVIAMVGLDGVSVQRSRVLGPNRSGTVVSRAKLEDSVYGWGEEVGSNSIEVHLHHLRRKLSPELIRNVRGVGYRIARID